MLKNKKENFGNFCCYIWFKLLLDCLVCCCCCWIKQTGAANSAKGSLASWSAAFWQANYLLGTFSIGRNFEELCKYNCTFLEYKRDNPDKKFSNKSRQIQGDGKKFWKCRVSQFMPKKLLDQPVSVQCVRYYIYFCEQIFYSISLKNNKNLIEIKRGVEKTNIFICVQNCSGVSVRFLK
jgi:hypothetical protein